jgi:opacity protein-like surface antigen
MKSLLLLPLLLSSCYSVTEVGVLHPKLGLQSTLRPHLNTINALKTSTRLGANLHPAVQLEAGPTTIRGNGEIYGVETAVKIRYPSKISPYMIGVFGVGTAQGWRGSDVRYTFTTELGAGVSLRATPRLAISLDYRYFHHSNGMTFFGDSTRQFFGLPKATKNTGHENGAIFVGVSYDF